MDGSLLCACVFVKTRNWMIPRRCFVEYDKEIPRHSTKKRIKSKGTHANSNPVWPTHYGYAQPFHPVN